jgi:protein-tyrosine phosphatase
VIDLHTHVLPGIDDGPPSVEGSLDLARAAAAAGTTTLVATPHITWDLPNTGATVAEGVAALQPVFDEAGIPIRIRTGGELAVSKAVELSDDELRALRLGGGDWILAECPLSSWATGFEKLLHALQSRGHRVVLAHPERSPLLQRDIDLVRQLVDAGMLSSITAGSMSGRFGNTVRRFTLDLLEQDLVHNVASDTHDALRRPPGGLDDAFASAERELPGISERREWMTVDVPRAVLDGGPVPEPPTETPRRKRRGLFRRGGRSR